MTRFAMLTFDSSFMPNPTAARSGHESLAEQWILDKLDRAVEAVNADLEARSFKHATEAVHAFQLYELCDVYLEAMKPLASASAPEQARRSVQQTLYTCLDATFRMLHPFMPFVTEELWQRLPRRPDDSCPSIMVAAYPTAVRGPGDAESGLRGPQNPSARDPQAEADFDVAFGIVRAARSLGDSIGLRTDLQCACSQIRSIGAHVRHCAGFAQVGDARLRDVLSANEIVLRTLVKGTSQLSIVADASSVPGGVLSEPVGAQAIVHLVAAGRINVEAEIAKIEGRKAKVAAAQQTAQRTQAGAAFDALPADVKAGQLEKARERQAEVRLRCSSKQ